MPFFNQNSSFPPIALLACSDATKFIQFAFVAQLYKCNCEENSVCWCARFVKMRNRKWQFRFPKGTTGCERQRRSEIVAKEGAEVLATNFMTTALDKCENKIGHPSKLIVQACDCFLNDFFENYILNFSILKLFLVNPKRLDFHLLPLFCVDFPLFSQISRAEINDI